MNGRRIFVLIRFKEDNEEKIVNNGIDAILEVFRLKVFHSYQN
jgi:hypothetical protein